MSFFFVRHFLLVGTRFPSLAQRGKARFFVTSVVLFIERGGAQIPDPNTDTDKIRLEYKNTTDALKMHSNWKNESILVNYVTGTLRGKCWRLFLHFLIALNMIFQFERSGWKYRIEGRPSLQSWLNAFEILSWGMFSFNTIVHYFQSICNKKKNTFRKF